MHSILSCYYTSHDIICTVSRHIKRGLEVQHPNQRAENDGENVQNEVNQEKSD